jgi:hypothetical protein
MYSVINTKNVNKILVATLGKKRWFKKGRYVNRRVILKWRFDKDI